ncbi:MAG: LysR family transcriptional regulator [Clostridia bacterium]|nr:LysR family transcriptional regulator [Clostridia bacterium]
MFKNKDYILTVYRERSFTKASKKLFVSQPSLSATIKRIEEKVSAPIFDRSSTPITLTDVGKEYVRYALEIESKEKEFATYISDHEGLLAGKIRVGGSSFFSSFILPKMVSNFNSEFPKIEFDIIEDKTKNLIEKLYDGELDIIIDNAKIADEKIISDIYMAESLLLAVPRSFDINQKLGKYSFDAEEIKKNAHLTANGIDFSHFSSLPFILLNHENDTGKRAESLFKKHEISPQILFRLDQQLTAYNIACSGMGVAFVSDTLVKRIGANPDIVYYKLLDIEATRNIYFYRKRNHYLSFACRTFIDRNTKTE